MQLTPMMNVRTILKSRLVSLSAIVRKTLSEILENVFQSILVDASASCVKHSTFAIFFIQNLRQILFCWTT